MGSRDSAHHELAASPSGIELPKVLILSDGATRGTFAWALQDHFSIVKAPDRTCVLAILREQRIPVVLLDLKHSASAVDGEETLQLLRAIRNESSDTKVIVTTAEGSRADAIRALSSGACDVVPGPIDVDLLRTFVRRACWIYELEQEWVTTHAEADDDFAEMIGTSETIRRVFGVIRKVATNDFLVLITGESGTGKELAAKAIHERSAREKGPFITINCGALPDTLLESELFGHEKGAFTGAVQQKKGKVEYAQGGTLFIDEVGELSLALQVKLLRFLQDRTIERVGGWQKIEVDARIIAATHVDLGKAIERGAFREDLYYRLGVVIVPLPPLRERGADVLLMARVFLNRASAQTRKRIHGFTKEAVDAIQTYPWPGNVRELLNKIRRAVVMADGTYITREDLDLPSPAHVSSSPPPTSLKEARQCLEADFVCQALTLHNGNLRRVAKELRVSRPTLYKLLQKHGLRDHLRIGRAV